jgi:hydrogenase maturation protease
MTRILVAGIGNMFFGDDGFGVEVARCLIAAPPADARVTGFGIRAVHLAFELLMPYELCIVVDCTPRGGDPGTLYVLEHEVPGEAEAAGDIDLFGGSASDAHSLCLPAVLAAVRYLGGRLPRLLVVGCEPGAVEPGIGLSVEVADAVPGAVALIRALIASRGLQETRP